MNTINDKTPGVRATQAQQGELPFQVLNEREMRQFYLNEARMMCPTATEARSEKARLEILQVRVRRLIKMFTDLHNFQWNEGVRQMQIGYGIYMMEHSISSKERRNVNDAWAQRLSAIVGMQSYNDLVNHMLMHYTRQGRDLEQLLAAYSADGFGTEKCGDDGSL